MRPKCTRQISQAGIIGATDIVWDDLRVSLDRAKAAGVNVPSWEAFKDDVKAYSFDDGDEVFFSVQMPHAWKEGTTLYPHLHWCPEGDVDPSDNVGIGLEYSWAKIGDDFGASTTITRDVPTGVNAAFKHLLHHFDVSGIDATGKTISTVLMCRFFRQAAVADNYAGGIFGLEIDFHYQMDMAGSLQETSKS
jgi:hypothetical protein